jgi:hypothetical protein
MPSKAKPPQPPPAWLSRHFPDRVHFLDNRKQRYPFSEKASFYGSVVRAVVLARFRKDRLFAGVPASLAVGAINPFGPSVRR